MVKQISFVDRQPDPVKVARGTYGVSLFMLVYVISLWAADSPGQVLAFWALLVGLFFYAIINTMSGIGSHVAGRKARKRGLFALFFLVWVAGRISNQVSRLGIDNKGAFTAFFASSVIQEIALFGFFMLLLAPVLVKPSKGFMITGLVVSALGAFALTDASEFASNPDILEQKINSVSVISTAAAGFFGVGALITASQQPPPGKGWMADTDATDLEDQATQEPVDQVASDDQFPSCPEDVEGEERKRLWLLDRLDEKLISGAISEPTYLELKEKYSAPADPTQSHQPHSAAVASSEEE